MRQKNDDVGGPNYKGRAVSRNDLVDSDSDDPFSKGFDEGTEDEDEDESEDGGVEVGGKDFSDEDDEDNDTEEEDIEDEEMDSDDEAGPNASNIRSNDQAGVDPLDVRSLIYATKSFASTLATGAQSDIAKGQAVKQQRKTFDTLLNTRIRLQKALISTNSIEADAYKEAEPPASSVQAAEAAALALLNNLTHLRVSLDEARTGQKRKRATFDTSTPSSEMWSSISATEKSSLPHRRAVLERWSNKTRATTVTNNKNRLNASATQTLTEVLDSQLNSSHLVTRTQTPRSCAPIQAAISTKGAQPDAAIYDDADFYGLMLKELLEQRSADNANRGTAEFVVQAPWQVAREAKTKKVVDTKASKGRRLRYTVQEKLQNFMAPEERGEWGDRQRDELFSSLFGQRMMLGEQDEVQSEEGDGGLDAEEAGLMLFRN